VAEWITAVLVVGAGWLEHEDMMMMANFEVV
jgi:hypothetical protein